jgi:hypothetical protein
MRDGGLDQHKEAARGVRGLNFIEHLLQDLRYAFRVLRRSRGSRRWQYSHWRSRYHRSGCPIQWARCQDHRHHAGQFRKPDVFGRSPVQLSDCWSCGHRSPSVLVDTWTAGRWRGDINHYDGSSINRCDSCRLLTSVPRIKSGSHDLTAPRMRTP